MCRDLAAYKDKDEEDYDKMLDWLFTHAIPSVAGFIMNSPRGMAILFPAPFLYMSVQLYTLKYTCIGNRNDLLRFKIPDSAKDAEVFGILSGAGPLVILLLNVPFTGLE